MDDKKEATQETPEENKEAEKEAEKEKQEKREAAETQKEEKKREEEKQQQENKEKEADKREKSNKEELHEKHDRESDLREPIHAAEGGLGESRSDDNDIWSSESMRDAIPDREEVGEALATKSEKVKHSNFAEVEEGEN